MIIGRSTGASMREFNQDLEKDRRTPSERSRRLAANRASKWTLLPLSLTRPSPREHDRSRQTNI
jgi:hypothetical protein